MVGKATIYRFDDVRVDLQTYRVFKAGRAVQLEPKAFEVLVFLIEHRGRVIDKSELLDAAWKESFVTQNAMTRVIAQLRRALGDKPQDARYIKTVQTRGYLFIPEVRSDDTMAEAIIERLPPPAHADRIQSLAVLPLENFSGDPAQDYLTDSLTDELITELAKIGSLRVISRTSVMQYKGARKSLPQIARELNVDVVIEGSALRAGERVRITAQLIHGATDSHLWAESYERPLGDLLALQNEVARTIARAIKVKLTPQDQARLTTARPVNPEAYDDYLKGIYYFHQGRDRMPATREVLEKSLTYFERAIRKDLDYALAHAGLASAYRWLASYGNPVLYLKAKREALAALVLDDTIAEAHAALGWVQFKYDWDWRGAEQSYRRAVELNPNTTYHQGYALLLAALGRHDEAIAHVRLAELSDPLNLTVKAVTGLVYFYARQFDRAIEQLRKIKEMDSSIVPVRWALGWCYEQRGDLAAAIRELEEAAALSGNLFGAGFLGHAYAVSGNLDQARRVLAQLMDTSKRKYVSPSYIAIIHMALDEIDQALAWLERACGQRDEFVIYLNVDPRFDRLRVDARFQTLLQQIGLAPRLALTRP